MNRSATRTQFVLRVLWICLFMLLSSASAFALDRDRTISQLSHRAWTARDGAPSQITALAQTTDGYLWIGTTHGLFRFDGIHFELYQPQTGEPFQSIDIFSLLAVPDDGLWIGYRFGGISFLKDGRVVNYAERDGLPPGRVARIARDRDGVIWAGVQTGLARFQGGRWKTVGEDWGFTGKPVLGVFVDRQGTLWVGGGGTVNYLPPGTRKFLPTGEQVGEVPQIVDGPGGTVWMTDVNHTSVRQVQMASDRRPSIGPNILDGSLGFLFDREDSLWVTTGEGLLRVRFPERLAGQRVVRRDKGVEVFNVKSGLTADFGWPILEDREGNIWVGSSAGLDQFRDIPLLPVPFYVRDSQFALTAGDEGDVWTGNIGRRTTRIHSGTWEIETLPMFTGAGLHGSSDELWLQEKTGILRLQAGHQQRIAWPKAVHLAQNYSWPMAMDRSGALWVSIDLAGIFRWDGSSWTHFNTPPDFANLVPLSASTDSIGRIWFGYGGGTVALIDGERMQTFTRQNGITVGSVKAISGDARTLWIGGELGLAVFDGTHFRPIHTAGEDALGGISGIVETADGALWLGTARGVIHIPPAEIKRALEEPAYGVDYELFDDRDGLPGIIQQGRPFPTAVQATDGRLWFATTGGVATLDPKRFFRNQAPPPVSIRSILADGKTYWPSGPLDLPPRTANLQIDYTALSLAVPERARFRYRLDGLDTAWHDAGTRRQAFYTNLSPRRYRFRVQACNDAGVWNEAGATVDFSIRPTFYQTTWFLILCGLGIATALLMVYLIRLRRMTAIFQGRLEERLDERERIARELHDTLLQSVQGLILRFHAVAKQIPEHEPSRRTMEQALDRADEVMAEGRERVRNLRAASDAPGDLSEAFHHVGEELAQDGRIAFRVLVEGPARELHPIVREEAFSIGREALINAFQHGRGLHVEVEIAYDRKELRLRFRDDGRGIDAEILKAGGRPGHWGLQGMRERAEKMGGHLEVWSGPKTGTEVELRIPASTAYRSALAKPRGLWLRRFAGRGW